jgi:outer membrane protein assembly factor BamB
MTFSTRLLSGYPLGWIATLAVVNAACGDRSPLDSRGVADEGGAVDASLLPEASLLPCSGSSNPGTVEWQTPLPSDASFTGPLAADEFGTTYFLGSFQGPSPTSYSVVALDSCGRTKWQSAPAATKFINGARTTLLVSGDHVIVQWGSVDAFDRTNGEHLWNVDLDTFAGESLPSDDVAEIGPSAAAADGAVFVVFETSSGAAIVSIAPDGTASTLTRLPPNRLGDLISLIVDGAGQVDVLLNTALHGALVDSVSRSGQLVFSNAFDCSPSFLGPMASGSSFIVMQSGPCVLTLEGQTGFSPMAGTGQYQRVAIDGQDNLYFAGNGQGVFSFDSTGHPRWTHGPTKFMVAGPLLASGGVLFVAEADLSARTGGASVVHLVEVDTGTGAAIDSHAVEARLPTDSFALLLTAAEQLVFVSNNRVTAVAAARAPNRSAAWPTPGGGADDRGAAGGW